MLIVEGNKAQNFICSKPKTSQRGAIYRNEFYDLSVGREDETKIVKHAYQRIVSNMKRGISTEGKIYFDKLQFHFV